MYSYPSASAFTESHSPTATTVGLHACAICQLETKKNKTLHGKNSVIMQKVTCDYTKGTCKIAQPVGKKASMEMKRSLDVKLKTKKSAASMETTTRKSAAFISLNRS